MPKVNNFREQPNLPKLEEEILKFWEKDKTFKKSVNQRHKNNSYVFYDGPPFATGLPHYGHFLASAIKDVIPRYHTMKGKRVERVWGWDCHGLPIENLLEKELELTCKQDIEKFGIANFNNACKASVLKYRDEWKKKIKRFGRWIDMDNDYKTMDKDYMESVWWVFSELWKRDLIYQGYKAMHVCPRCVTPLSNFEVTLGYKDIMDLSVIVEFKVLEKSVADNQALKKFKSKKISLLAWTTTPWTLPGNSLLAVNKDLDYVVCEGDEANNLYILAKDRLQFVFEDDKYKIVDTINGSDLTSLKYEPLFPYYQGTKNAFRIVEANFVNTKEGTGVVHIAPGFGEDDFQLGKKENIKLIKHVTLDGKFAEEVKDFVGLRVKPKENHQKTDKLVIKWLQENDKLFKQVDVNHSYPHCWRCDTPLLNYATECWFVRVQKIKDQLIKNNQEINWSPAHIKNGRFGKWLEGARDWAISRSRYWGAPLPIWKSKDNDYICVGSVEELEKLSGQKVNNLHKQFVDKIEIKKDGKSYFRIPEVLDCWFESGSMPYGSFHYPFENKHDFENNFPAAFISEGQDQTRGWFYTLHVLATALTYGNNPAIKVKKSTSSFKNVICTGLILAEDGKKMSKRLKNYPEPDYIWDKYGADSLRLYLMSSSVLKAESLLFSEKEVSELRRRVLIIWWNMISFLKTYGDQKINPLELPKEVDHVMDKWLVSRLNSVLERVSKSFDDYDVVNVSRLLVSFVNELSTWYLRLSRDRLRSKNNEDVSQIFAYALYKLAQMFAPIIPFFTELVHHNLVNEKTSIHLSDWPKVESKSLNQALEDEMTKVQKIVEFGRAARKESMLKVRQPLTKMTITLKKNLVFKDQVEELITSELNLKTLVWKVDAKANIGVVLDEKLTPQLKAEGEARDIVRKIQNKRRKMKLQAKDQAQVTLSQWPEEWQSYIEEKTNSKLSVGEGFEVSTE